MIDRNKIINLYEQKTSKNAIAKDLGCSRAYVYKVLIEAGMYRKKRKRKAKS